MRSNRFLSILAILSIAILSAQAQDIASFEKRITVKKLANGLTVIILERSEAPVFSFVTLVDAGAVQDPMGRGGLAHMFEHIAFKGSTHVGSENYAKEKIALEKLEKAYQDYDKERRKNVGRDEKKLVELDTAWRDANEVAQQYVHMGAFEEIVAGHGGTGVNAQTDSDSTMYFYSLPVNQIELWAYMESERFLNPVYREFYKERDVVVEERRMRTDSQPIGRLIEQLGYAAYSVHPYHRPVVGPMNEISNVTIADARKFFNEYYKPSNMTIALAGDLKAEKIMPIIEAYFGRIPAGDKPLDNNDVEPPQLGERKVVLRELGNPWYLEGYHRPDYRDPDDAVYDAITDLMSNGRTNRLYRSLVRDQKIAVQAGGFTGFPGSKYPSMFMFYAIPNKDKTVEQCAQGIRNEIERLKNEDISDDELQSLKTRAKAGLIRGLGDNSGLAQQLAYAQARWGDWRELFRQVDRIDKVSKADIHRVANKTFIEQNRTIGIIEPPMPSAEKVTPGGQR
jgi:predicted Zn-dependent peptidase